MRKSGFSVLSLVAGVCLLPAAAFAQDAPAPAPAPAPAAAPAPAQQPPAAPAAEPAPPADHAPGAAAAEAPPPPPAPAEAAPAAPTYPQTTIGGGIEGTYHHVFSKPLQPEGTKNGVDMDGNDTFQPALPTRAYDSVNGFLLNQASLFVKHQLNEHVYGQIRFDAGANAGINSVGTSRLFDVREAYAVATGMGLTFTAGKFATYEGIEVIDGWLNPTVTRGFLYYMAEPITHVGAKLHYTAGPLDIGAGVVNGWDTNNGYFATGDNNSQKTVIWRAAYTTAPFWAAFSGTYGVEKNATDKDPRLSLDLTGAAIVSPMLTINFQGNYGSEKNVYGANGDKTGTWLGFGVQPLVHVDAFSLGARFEYFSDKGLSRTGFAAPAVAAAGKEKIGLWNVTIAPGYTIAGALLLRAEFRVDGADQKALWGDKKTQTSLGFGAAYTF
ncbi:MAG TPA: outer membrane beta-barrel protein [Polyangiaceae bacterium]|nr:outer membrane beta-barrel protein [Polyangiaceae bacterium]